MSRRIVLVLGLFSAAIYFIGIASYAEAQKPNTDPRCKGLTGAAYGMCVSAIAIGCDDPENAPQGCTQIEDNFTQITGESPPWVSLCPEASYYKMVVDYLLQQGASFFNGGSCIIDLNGPPFYSTWVEVYGTDGSRNLINVVPNGGDYYTFGSLSPGAGIPSPGHTTLIENSTGDIILACEEYMLALANELIDAGFPLTCNIY